MYLLLLAILLSSCGEKKSGPIDTIAGQDPDVHNAVMLIKESKWDKAAKMTNVALLSKPENAGLHLINGIIYEHLAKQGGSENNGMAKVAYETAFNINPNSWVTCYFFGKYLMRNKQYGNAQNMFALGLMLKSNQKDLLLGMSVASYYARDISLAKFTIDKFLKTYGKTISSVSAAAMIYSAYGDHIQASKYSALLHEMAPQHAHHNTKQRIADWEKVHISRLSKATAQKASSNAKNASAKSTASEYEKDPIVIMECAVLLIRMKEVGKFGVNLLESHPSTITNAAGNPVTKLGNLFMKFNPGTWNIGGGNGLTPTYQGGSIGLSDIQYTLNIANSMKNMIEVVARPTLTTFVGKTSSFHHGDTLHGTMGGNYADLSGINTGVSLSITPIATNGDEVTFSISFKVSVLNSPALLEVAMHSQTIDSHNSSVQTDMKTKFGQTTLIAGMRQTMAKNHKSKTPGLSAILPLFFSSTQREKERNIVMLFVTPVKPGIKTSASTESFYNRYEGLKHVMEYMHREGIQEKTQLSSMFEYLFKAEHEYRHGDILASGQDFPEEIEREVYHIARLSGYA